MLGPNNRPRMRMLNIHEVTEHVRQLIEAESSDQIAVVTDYDPSIPPFEADPEWLIQATLNIARQSLTGAATTIRNKPPKPTARTRRKTS